MDLDKAIEPVTVLRTRPAERIERARETGQPIVITQHGKATAVLQVVDSYQRQQQTLRMLKLIAHGAQEIRLAKGIPHQEVERRIRKRGRPSRA